MTPKKWWHYLFIVFFVGGFIATALIALSVALIYPTLPSLETLTDYRPKLPLRVYSAEGDLIAWFGEERRAFVRINDIPQNLKDAVLAIEDRRFYQHRGVDYHGIARAIKNNLSGVSREGASTITMQVAKNFFSHGKRGLKEKIYETLLALKIEKNLSKDKILELYMNQIYLGQRAYGFAAAAHVYFGKSITDLSLAESAMLAGLPKSPSTSNPLSNLNRATVRQHEVLRDMHRFGFIDDKNFETAMSQPLKFKGGSKKNASDSKDLNADYVAEIIRQELYNRYQDEIYTSGLKVYTTIKKANQLAANAAVLQGIMDYEMRQSFRGPESWVAPSTLISDKLISDKNYQNLDIALDNFETFNGLTPAIVLEADAKEVLVYAKHGEAISITAKGLSLVQKILNEKDPKKRQFGRGAIVRIVKNGESWKIAQLPKVESALIGLNPKTGAITSLVGGFDFHRNKFNHATQAWRQPGSSFKPFVYSAALEKGVTPASIFEDEPLSMVDGTGQQWDPENFDEKHQGPMRVREALTKSKNLVSIRILQAVGARYTQDYITKFGFSAKDHPAYLTMALGAGQTTPWQLAGGYAVFANGGYRIKPHLIAKITDSEGRVIEESNYSLAGYGKRSIDVRNTFIMTSMLQSVVRNGTAVAAMRLGRSDIAGKTGTTNDQKDAWFAGYTPHEVAVVWVGYDQPKSLGKNETGGRVALPIWIQYMATALKGFPDNAYAEPEGIISYKIDPVTGTRAGEFESGIYEYFYHENPPPALIPTEPDAETLVHEEASTIPIEHVTTGDSSMNNNNIAVQEKSIPSSIKNMEKNNPPIESSEHISKKTTPPIKNTTIANDPAKNAARLMSGH